MNEFNICKSIIFETISQFFAIYFNKIFYYHVIYLFIHLYILIFLSHLQGIYLFIQ